MSKQNQDPPRFALRLLAWFCPARLYEEIEGDLIQKFQRDLKVSDTFKVSDTYALRRAQRRFIWNTFRFLRPGIILRNRFSIELNEFYMLRNYIKIAFRNFRSHKSYTFLNIIGLSLGLAASLLIFQYVKFESSFDTFHTKASRIYRLQYNGWQNGQLNFESAVAVPAAARALKDNFPEVEEFTRFYPVNGVMTYKSLTRGEISFREQKMQFADSSSFKIFDFGLVKGNARTALKGPFKTVLSERAAKKYFGDEDPIGKTLTRNGNKSFQITGVFKDIPATSHIKFDFLFSYETLNGMTDNGSETSWGWYDFYTYVLLKPGTDVQALQAKWNEYLLNARKTEWDKNNSFQEFILRPLTGIHLYSHLLYESQPEDQRDGDSIYALSAIGLFILIIAWVNYINLATARSLNRANEVGVRKVIGAFRTQLINQFLTESFILNVIAASIAILVVRLGWTSFSILSGWSIPLDFIYQRDFWILVVSLFAAGALLSGFYPAIILSSFKPVDVLKGKIVRSGSGNILRKSLVVFQFVTSIFLISGSIIVYEQLQYMKFQDLGVQIDKTLVMKGPGIAKDSIYAQSLESFKNEVTRIPGVKSITASTNIPGDEIFWTQGIRRLSGGPASRIVVSTVGIDQEYVASFGIKVIAGRNFDKKYPNDNKRVLLNRSLANILEFKDPASAIGQRVAFGDTLEIVGILEDYHQMSLKDPVVPMAFHLQPSSTFYAMKMETANYKNVLQAIEGPWKSIFPGNPIDYFFLDQFYNRQYDKDDRFGQVFNLFTGLAIFIACLGLFGLASFMTVRRTKEIGIRKVLGSTVSGIVILLSKGFIQLVLIANLIAWPLAWWIMEKWLQTFPYRITINPLFFVLSGLSVVIIAFLSVSSQTLRAALTQPADTLKYE